MSPCPTHFMVRLMTLRAKPGFECAIIVQEVLSKLGSVSSRVKSFTLSQLKAFDLHI